MVATEKREHLQAQINGPEKAVLAEVVRKALGSETAVIAGWRVDALAGEYLEGAPMGAATGGVYRVSGSALESGREGPSIPWTVVLKVVRFDTPGSQVDFKDESHPLYWKREALAYRSDLM